MAFVYRSERVVNITGKDKSNVGPGQYIKVNPLNPAPTKAPFNSSNTRDKVKLDSTPGPGSYNIQPRSHQEISKSINTNTSTVDLNSSNPPVKGNEKLGFLTKVNRFQENDVYQGPDPGHYDITREVSKDEKKSVTSLIPPRKNVVNTGSIKRIVSIPSKEMHGYVLEDNGNALMLLDSILNDDPPNKQKHNDLGPGSYEVPSSWKTNAIEWKKTCHEGDKAKKAKKSEKVLIEELKRQGDFVPKVPSSVETKKLVYSRLHNALGGLPLPAVKKQQEREMSYIAVSDSPGPGYYTKEFVSMDNNDSFNKKDQNKRYGGLEERFKESNCQDVIGPTSYFQQRNRYEPNKKYFKGLQTKNLHKANETKIDSIRQVNRIESKAGPGSYDIAQGFLKKSVSAKEIFDSGIQRFIDPNQKEVRPGPGTYDQQVSSNVIIPDSITQYYKKETKLERYQLPRTSSPPVGSYNPEVLSSIHYQIESKVNPAQANIAPFHKTGKRFDFDKVSPLGPGSYSKSIINAVDRGAKNSCFNSKDKRFRVVEGNKVGPSDYDVSQSVEWDKKSFNVLFFQPKNK